EIPAIFSYFHVFSPISTLLRSKMFLVNFNGVNVIAGYYATFSLFQLLPTYINIFFFTEPPNSKSEVRGRDPKSEGRTGKYRSPKASIRCHRSKQSKR